MEVLLITTRETRRWVIPKGNRIAGLAPHEAAAREAYEEAGISGPIDPVPIGLYRYRKRRRDGRMKRLEVTVFALAVTNEADRWPERAERSRRWHTLSRAVAIAGEAGLAELLGTFVPPAQDRLVPLSSWLAMQGTRWRLFRAWRLARGRQPQKSA